MGADRRLARWDPIRSYLRDLAASSDRLLYEEYGLDWGGKPLVLLTISAPDNLSRLDDLRAVQQQLYDPRSTSPGIRPSLLATARCICLLTCSIHATEVGPTQFAPEFVHELLTDNSDNTLRILQETIILIIPCLNPSGLDLVTDWYDRTLGTPHEGSPPPELYHPYAGHDNNRDWIMLTQAENRATVEHVFNRWRPQIVFDLHQMQMNGPRFVLPPYVDPYDPNVDPILIGEIDALGSAVAAHLTASGMAGVATSVIFDAFSPSRTIPHFHGGVRILAEAAGARIASPAEIRREFLAETRGFDPRVASHVHPIPWEGGVWRLRDIVDYLRAAAFALVDHAARYRDRWVANFSLVQEHAVAVDQPSAFAVLPLTFQRDPGTASELLGVLIKAGVEIHRALDPFVADGVELPADTFVIHLGQPSGRLVKTLLEIQHYPGQPLYPGGPPKAPYDVTSHTLPLQMGVDTIRLESPVSVRSERLIRVPEIDGGVTNAEGSNAVIIGPETNNAVRAVNRLLARGIPVFRCDHPISMDDRRFPPGAFVVKRPHAATIDGLARECSVTAIGADVPSDLSLRALHQPRIGLYRSWRSNATDEGWARFVLEQYEFPYRSVRDAEVKRGDLFARYDVILLPHQPARDILEGNSQAEYPPEFAGGIGDLGAANLRRFVEAGGMLIALDGACDLAIRQLYLPVSNVLETIRPEIFSAPGSLLRVLIDADHPIGWGFEREAAAMFVSSPAFEVRGAAQVVAQYPLTNQLLSGWLHGGEQIAGRAAIVDLPVGLGRAVLIGIRPHFRAQTRGTYRLLFNAIYFSVLGRRPG